MASAGRWSWLRASLSFGFGPLAHRSALRFFSRRRTAGRGPTSLRTPVIIIVVVGKKAHHYHRRRWENRASSLSSLLPERTTELIGLRARSVANAS
jgi:hypothetical protein